MKIYFGTFLYTYGGIFAPFNWLAAECQPVTGFSKLPHVATNICTFIKPIVDIILNIHSLSIWTC